VNAASGMGQSPEGTVPSNNASRRTFLKGVGLAGAAGLAGPLLASTSARASAEGIILGSNAPGTYPQFIQAVPNAVGCRSYRDTVIMEPGDVPATFPGEAGSKVVASIRPDPDTFLNGDTLDAAISAMIADGAANFSAPQLTVWHEAGNLYHGAEWDKYNITATKIRQMHVKMQNLCNEVAGPHVGYGCIIYGDIATMDEWIPYSPYALDWYGIDVYWNDNFDFSTYAKLKAYMDDYLALARGRTGLTWPKINICETNTHLESNRPGFFSNVALWLNNNGGRRMLTFFKDDPAPSGGPWDPDDKDTIAALNAIQAAYG
jgi:hypothetical protein